jgi:hypothetical protein
MPHAAYRVWTEFRPRFGLLMAATLSAGVLIGLERGASQVLFALILVGAIGASLLRDGYMGVVIGLVGAGGLLLVQRLSGTLTQRHFFLLSAEVAAVMLVSWLVGILGHHLRTSVERATRETAGSVRPTANLMGVLSTDIGLHRLTEELRRRELSGGSLGLAVLSFQVSNPSDVDIPEAARRAIARHVESVVDDTDVVFAAHEDALAIILPTADWASGLSTLGRVAVAASEATYADPIDRSRRDVSHLVTVRSALAFADDATTDARSLLEAALAGLNADNGLDA